MICSNCGEENKKGKFCVNCGIKLEKKKEKINIITIGLLCTVILLVISIGVLIHLYSESNKELSKYKTNYSNAINTQNIYKKYYEKAYDLYQELYIEKYGENNSFKAYREFRQKLDE